MTEYIDLSKVLQASLWKQIMTEVEGSLSEQLYLSLRLKLGTGNLLW